MTAAVHRRAFLGTGLATLAATPALFGQDKPPALPVPTDERLFNPDTLFLTWQRDPTTTITIQWVSKTAGEPIIRYADRGKNEWVVGPTAAKKPFPVVQTWYGLLTGPTDLNVFRAELTKLTPGTEYEFKIGTMSPTYRFRTMPAKATRAFSFVSGGDSGIGIHAVNNNKIAAKQDPMFVLIGGDLGYDNGTSADTALQFIRNYSQTMTDTQGRLIPLVTCIGNHEVAGGYNRARKDATFFFPLFDGLYKDTSHATLDFGDYLSLVLLDSGHVTKIAGDQTKWLEKALADRQGKAHLVPVNHVPCYPSYRVPEGRAGALGTGEEQRKHWVPLFEKYQADFVLEHHDHTFKRTKPLRGGVVDEKTGIVYLGDGSWGKLRIPKPAESRPYLAEASATYHMTLHRLEGEQSFHLALDEFGKVLDVCHTGKKPRGSRAGVS